MSVILIRILGIYALIGGVAAIFRGVTGDYNFLIGKYHQAIFWYIGIGAPIVGIISCISGIGVLFLKNWARNLIIISFLYFLSTNIVCVLFISSRGGIITNVLINVFIIYYFMRSTVKEQFK